MYESEDEKECVALFPCVLYAESETKYVCMRERTREGRRERKRVSLW